MFSAIILGLIALVVILAVAWPLVRPARDEDRLDPLSANQRRRLALREERDLALSALNEIELDLATHHIGEDDYAELVADYRARAAAAISALDAEGESTVANGPA